MTLSFIYDGTTLSTADYVRLGAMSLATSAHLGNAATSGVPFDDPDLIRSFVGWKHFAVDESAASPTRVWSGNIIVRDLGHIGGSQGRLWDASLFDLNNFFVRRTMRSRFANRPAESGNDRIAWLLSSGYLPVYDNGEVINFVATVPAADYRGQTPLDVMNDLVGAGALPGDATGRDFFLYWDDSAPAGQEISLYLQKTTYTGFASSLRISNDLADLDSTTFAPDPGAKLNIDPARIYSGVYVRYNGGKIYLQRQSTKDAFFTDPEPGRDVFLELPNVTTEALATIRGTHFLDVAATEEEKITCTILLPKSQVNDLIAGHRVEVKFTHLQGYQSFTWVRVLDRTVGQLNNQDLYPVALTLSNPRPAGGSSGGSTGDNTHVLPGDTVPFNGTCSTATYIQGVAASPSGGAGPETPVTATLGAAPTSGSLLVAMLTASSSTPITSSWPAGWQVITGLGAADNGEPGNTRTYFMECGLKISDGTETTLSVDLNPGTGAAGRINYAEYGGFGGISSIAAAGACPPASPASAPCTIPSVTPTAPGLLLFLHQHDDDGYAITSTTTYTERLTAVDGINLTRYVLHDAVISSPSGSYTGTIHDTGLSPAQYSLAQVYVELDCPEPSQGQPVDGGSTTVPGTDPPPPGTTPSTPPPVGFPYAPGSLTVLVNGIHTFPTETDPTTGAYALTWTPSAKDIIDTRYQGA